MLKLLGVAATLAVTASVLAEQEDNHDMKMQHMNAGSSLLDPRTLVHFPEQLRIHTMANMRDHLLALQEIQEALSREQFEKAGEIELDFPVAPIGAKEPPMMDHSGHNMSN